MKNSKIILLSILILTIFSISCKKDKEDPVPEIEENCTQSDLSLQIDSISWYTETQISGADTYAFVMFYIDGNFVGEKLTYIDNGLGVMSEVCIDYNQNGVFECSGSVTGCNNYYADLYEPVTTNLSLYVYCDSVQEDRGPGSDGCWGSGEHMECNFPSDTLYYFNKKYKTE